ncbi:MAG: ribosome silencing factor [Clostridia bacterium]|nr:ribosome silencing factor [Clostridia bacterium]
MTIDEIWQRAVYTLDQHKAEDIRVLGVSGITSIADYFLLASGGSANQVRSLSDYVEEALAREGKHPLRTEGYTAGDWITLDYGDVMVHIFRRETRDFYDLERLWVDAAAVDIGPYLYEQ